MFKWTFLFHIHVKLKLPNVASNPMHTSDKMWCFLAARTVLFSQVSICWQDHTQTPFFSYIKSRRETLAVLLVLNLLKLENTSFRPILAMFFSQPETTWND